MAMRQKMTILLVVAVLLIVVALVYGQMSKKRSGGSQLTQTVLQQATSVVFSESSGTVDPDYQWQYTVTVTQHDVRLVITRKYGKETTYDQCDSLSESRYQQFVTALAGQEIRKTKPTDVYSSGGGSSYIKVLKDDATLFQGAEDYDLALSNGRLSDAFCRILPREMQQVVNEVRYSWAYMEDTNNILSVLEGFTLN